MKTKLGFFGAGKMAEGILAAASLMPDFDPQTVLMAEKVPARARELAKRYGVRTTPDAREVARSAPLIFLAVRPQTVNFSMCISVSFIRLQSHIYCIKSNKAAQGVVEENKEKTRRPH